MSERALHANTKSELQELEVYPFVAIYADFPSGDVRIWTGNGTLSWNSQTWLGIGAVLEIEPIVETRDTRAVQVGVTVSGLEETFFDPVMVDGYHGRAASMWLGLLDKSAGTVINDPYLVFSGVMDTDELTDDGASSKLKIVASNRMADLLRPREWRYTHEHQQALYPGKGDKGLEYVASLQDLQINWGKPSNKK